MTVTASQGSVAVRAFQKIADRWGLEPAARAALLGVVPRTISRWNNDRYSAEPSRDTMERISHLIHIYEDLATLFGRGELADTWLKRPNRDFGGRPPLERLQAGNVEDIICVRRYLDLARQGW